MRSSITLFDDQYKLYKTGSKKLLIAFVEYMFEGIEPNLKPSEMNIFNSLRDRMDNSIKAHDGRSKGGKNSHGGPSKNGQKMNEKGTKNEQKIDENGIQDINSDLQTINSGTTAIKRKKEDILLSKDNNVEESTTKNVNEMLYEIYPFKSKGIDRDKCDKLISKQLQQGATIEGMAKEMKLEGLELRINQGLSFRYGKKLETWLKEYVEGMADSEDRLKKLLTEHRKRLENGPSYKKNPRNELCDLFGTDYVNKLFMETKQGIRLFTS